MLAQEVFFIVLNSPFKNGPSIKKNIRFLDSLDTRAGSQAERVPLARASPAVPPLACRPARPWRQDRWGRSTSVTPSPEPRMLTREAALKTRRGSEVFSP